MKKVRILTFIFALILAAPCVLRTHLWAAWAQSGQGAAAQSLQPSALKIVAPKPDEKLQQTSVTVRYQQVSPASASGTPTYELRLDDRDPVQTTDTSYTFNGLKPGAHDLIVQVVDANNVPISGTRSEVHFVVAGPATGAGITSESSAAPPSMPPQSSDLPSGGSSLPLLSVIGFGILVGGVISALRTRPVHK
jgi:hypothetical protein